LRVLLSYNDTDAWLTHALRATLFLLDQSIDFVLSPDPAKPGGTYPADATGVDEFDGLLLVAGPGGFSAVQRVMWHAASIRAANDEKFALVPILVGNAQTSRLDGPACLEWTSVPVVTDREMVFKLVQRLTRIPR
jgi:hypothetical protein